jgi:hypothetical protein
MQGLKWRREEAIKSLRITYSSVSARGITFNKKNRMDEIEIPTEHLHETIQEKVKEAGESGWFMLVAISTALMAVFAAIAGLMAGHHSNEALIEQIKASDQWAYYQAKGIKAEIKVLESKSGIVEAGSVEKYKKEQETISEKAKEAEAISQFHLDKHVTLARAVTLFQIAIAISAISILTRKKWLWIGSIFIAAAGLLFFILGFL